MRKVQKNIDNEEIQIMPGIVLKVDVYQGVGQFGYNYIEDLFKLDVTILNEKNIRIIKTLLYLLLYFIFSLYF